MSPKSTATAAQLVSTIGAVDVSVADSAGCTKILGQLRNLQGWVDAATAEVSSRLRVLHDTAGGAPAADVHTKTGGVSASEGRRRDQRSKTIDEAPTFGDALSEGAIGAEHVDALANATAKLDEQTKTSLLDREDDLLADAIRMSPEKFGRSCRDLIRRIERDQGIERNRRQRKETFLSRKLNGATGMIEGRFAFHAELANQIFGAVDAEVAAMIKSGERSGDPAFSNRTIDRNRLAAEALGSLVAGGHQQARPTEADITAIVDADTLVTGELSDGSVCETSEGAALPPASIRRLACQGRITPVIVDTNGVVLAAGRTIRNANRAQRRALRSMYSCCGFDGCDVAFDRCEVHHIDPWEHGGPTDLENLIPICSRHHHVVHEGGWQLDLADDRTLTITRPDGVIHARCGPDLADPHRQRRRRRAA